MASLQVVKPKTAVEKRTKTTVDTIMLTPESVAKWKLPSGQRPLRENSKVRALVESLKLDRGVLPGIVTLGILDGVIYIIDGQHRIHAFILSALKEGFADVRYLHATEMREINREYVELNSRLVSMRPDDFLRGMEDSIPALQEIRSRCPFVGYDSVRRGTTSPVLSMSMALRSWRASSMESPSSGVTGMSAMDLAETMVDENEMCDFLEIAYAAFGRDVEYSRLWTALNLVLSMWLYRRLVLTQYSPKSPRLDKVLFKKCLLSISADSSYLDWLLGRKMGDRDRSPAYSRIKTNFAKRLEAELGKKVMLPQPAWAGN